MSLNWNAADTEVYADLMTRGEDATYTDIEGAVLDAIIWTTLAVDLPGIPNKGDVEEFVWRAGLLAAIGHHCCTVKGQPFAPTADDLTRYIGLTTNVSRKTRLQFVKKTLLHERVSWSPKTHRIFDSVEEGAETPI